MSYAHNDHWEWVESNYPGVKCSELGKQVANILGFVGRGIYNAPINAKKVNWDNPLWVEVSWRSGMANWDFPQLTLLVIECHRRMVRVEISPNMSTLKLMFHQRASREGSTATRLPDIEEMVALVDRDWKR